MKNSCNCEIFSTQWYLARCQEGECYVQTIKELDKKQEVIKACFKLRKPKASKEEIDRHINWAILSKKCIEG
jgi:hypothetical protein